MAVAAAILAAVEDGILPPGMASLNAELTATPARRSAGQAARLYGRRDARQFTKQIRRPRLRVRATSRRQTREQGEDALLTRSRDGCATLNRYYGTIVCPGGVPRGHFPAATGDAALSGTT